MGYMYKKGKNWRIMVCKNGKRKDISLGSNYQKAQIIKSSIEQACRNSRFQKNLVDTLVELGVLKEGRMTAVSNSGITWQEAGENLFKHLEKIRRAGNTVDKYKRVIKSIGEILNPSKPSDVTLEKADRWIEALLNTNNKNYKSAKKLLTNSTVNTWVRTARSVFHRFVRWRYIPDNPFTNCEMPKVDFSLPRPLTEEEIGKMLLASNKPLKRVIKILVNSGMRPNELYNLTWKRVHLLKNPYIFIKRDGNWTPKAHTERMIPIFDELKKALGKAGKPEDLVAGKNEKGYKISKNWLDRSFRRMLKRAGLHGKRITVYCCRDTYATNLALNGHEAHVIAARLGHRNISTSMRYVSVARLNLEGLKMQENIKT